MEGKRFLITGATGSIGGAIAKELALKGANLVLGVRDVKKIEPFLRDELVGIGHYAIELDLNNLDSISEVINSSVRSFGRYAGFVHAAGNGEVRPIKLTSPSFMAKVMNVNFFSFIEIIRSIIEKNAREEDLRIVGISATGAFLGNSTKTAYCASKAAMNSAVRCLAKELANKKVRINTVAPGATRSNMMEDLKNIPGGQETLNKILERQFLGICEPKDIADAVIFLLSDEAKMISGTCLPVDGGRLIS